MGKSSACVICFKSHLQLMLLLRCHIIVDLCRFTDLGVLTSGIPRGSLRYILGISWRDDIPNEEVMRRA